MNYMRWHIGRMDRLISGNKLSKEPAFSSCEKAKIAGEALHTMMMLLHSKTIVTIKNKEEPFPYTFCAGGLSFDVFYQNKKELPVLFEKLHCQLLLIRLQLSQLLFPGSLLMLNAGLPSANQAS